MTPQEKKIYDKNRHLKIKNGTWQFNLKPPASLSKEQEEHLIGSLLGDANLYKYKNQINAGISIGRKTSDIEYLKYQYELYKSFCSNGIYERKYLDKRTNKFYSISYFRTVACPVFSVYREKWYPKGIKIIPNDIVLTPTICAIWFCDDGSVVSKKPTRIPVISLYTDGFSKYEVFNLRELLCKTISDNGFEVQKKPNDKYYLRSVKSGCIAFIDYINKFMPESMNRKSNIWRKNNAFLHLS